jgi:hypothetical protein
MRIVVVRDENVEGCDVLYHGQPHDLTLYAVNSSVMHAEEMQLFHEFHSIPLDVSGHLRHTEASPRSQNHC